MDGTRRRRRPSGVSRNGSADRSVAEWLDLLFASVRPPDGSTEFSHEQVARALRCAGGPAVSARTIDRLRSGTLTNPTIDQIQAIATFFGASPVGCFGAEAGARLARDLAMLDALRNPAVRALGTRLAGMTSGDVAVVGAQVDALLAAPSTAEHRAPSTTTGGDRPS
jgi:ESX-1-secreted protein regulator